MIPCDVEKTPLNTTFLPASFELNSIVSLSLLTNIDVLSSLWDSSVVPCWLDPQIFDESDPGTLGSKITCCWVQISILLLSTRLAFFCVIELVRAFTVSGTTAIPPSNSSPIHAKIFPFFFIFVWFIK